MSNAIDEYVADLEFELSGLDPDSDRAAYVRALLEELEANRHILSRARKAAKREKRHRQRIRNTRKRFETADTVEERAKAVDEHMDLLLKRLA